MNEKTRKMLVEVKRVINGALAPAVKQAEEMDRRGCDGAAASARSTARYIIEGLQDWTAEHAAQIMTREKFVGLLSDGGATKAEMRAALKAFDKYKKL